MRKIACVLLLATSGCYYQGYAIRKVGPMEPPVSREEVERLSAAGVSEPVIIELIEKRGAAPLSPDDLVALKKAGAADAVVQKMIAAERKVENVVFEDVYPAPYYYYDYPYYASFGYGFGWGWGYYRTYPHGYAGVRVYR